MSKGLDFGALRKKSKGETDVDQTSSTGTAAVSEPIKKPTRNRMDWKKKYEETQKELDSWVKSAGERSRHMDEMAKELGALRKSHAKTFNELTELKTWADAVKKEEKEAYELSDEIHRLKVQDNMSKKVIDKLTKDAQKYQFRPQQYSKIINILNCLQINTNKRQRERLIELIGVGNSIYAVRDAIIGLLEAPYVE